jgi:fructosamine-3-kinase
MLDKITGWPSNQDLPRIIEQTVSTYLGRTWQVQYVQDKVEEASHPAAILADDTFAIFVKLGEGSLAQDQLEKEALGLSTLTDRAGVLTPTVVGIIPVAVWTLFIMEGVQVIKRETAHWLEIGRALATLHQVKGERCGFETYCYWGSLYQDNRPLPDWVEFYRTRRLEPRLKAAVDSGNLPPELVSQVEQVIKRLPELVGPTVTPALLHGDAHHNNFISTTQGPLMIDPAVYYGHPEMDLAYVDFFAPVPVELFHGYQEVRPIDSGFPERRALWRLYAWLALVQVVGAEYMPQLTAALRSYI